LLAIVTSVTSEETTTLSVSDDDATLLQLDQEAKNDLLVTGRAFHITKQGKRGASYLCNTKAFNDDTKLEFKSGWLWVKRYKGTEYCMFFWDNKSSTFVNVADNDKSVLISFQKNKNALKKSKVVLKLFDTNRYAPGPHPFEYGGFTKRQFVVKNSPNGENILCYKFLNAYQLKSESWVKSQTFQLRHHKNCNFDFFYINIDKKKLKPRHKWREEDEDSWTKHDEERERENEEEGSHEEKSKIKKEQDRKDGKGGNCGCCCDDAKGKDHKDKSGRGEPDDDDDVDEIVPGGGKKPKPWVPTGTCGGGKPTPPKVDPTTPIRPPTPDPVKPPGKGELNVDFNLYVERPFYVISAVGENRYLDVIDGRDVNIKTPNEYDSQKWWFDQKSKTIKNSMYEDKSLDITNGGRSTDC